MCYKTKTHSEKGNKDDHIEKIFSWGVIKEIKDLQPGKVMTKMIEAYVVLSFTVKKKKKW